MITNERQYKITKALLGDVEETLARAREASAQLSDEIRELHLAALAGNLESLQAKIDEYEALRGGKDPLTASGLEELPILLIKARIRRGWTQRQLAGKLGLKEQQIQRYEAHEYHGVTLERLTDIANVLDVRVLETVGA